MENSSPVGSALRATRWSVMSDVRPEDALQVSQRALSKVIELEGRYEDEIEDLSEQLLEVQLRLSEIDDSRSYADYTLDEKIGIVREYAYKKAKTQGGKTKLTYDDIMWGVFDGEPSPSHCYKLLRKAAGITQQESCGGTVPGFRCRDPDSGTFHLAVDANRVKEGAAFYSENKAISEGGR